MIIRFPTGLYRDILPKREQDGGNVTYTISNTTPPRANLVFPKIPVGLVDRGRERPKGPSAIDSRPFQGELIYTTSGAKRTATSSNSRQFEIGQVIDFGTVETKVAEPMLVAPMTEIQHNNNMLDYERLGLTAAEQAVVAAESLKSHSKLTDDLNDLKRRRADAEIDINMQQKLINETNKTLAALEVIALTSDDVAALVVKLKAKRDAAFAARDAALAAANSYATQAEAVVARLRAVATVLK